jgi:hypothetical protein
VTSISTSAVHSTGLPCALPSSKMMCRSATYSERTKHGGGFEQHHARVRPDEHALTYAPAVAPLVPRRPSACAFEAPGGSVPQCAAVHLPRRVALSGLMARRPVGCRWRLQETNLRRCDAAEGEPSQRPRKARACRTTVYRGSWPNATAAGVRRTCRTFSTCGRSARRR